MIQSGFFNSVNGDRKYNADFFSEFFGTLIGNGVFPQPSTGLQVVTNEKLTVSIKPGKGWINGYFIINDADYNLTLDNADGVLKRMDRIVLRLDNASREITISVKKGVFSSEAVAPNLQRDAEIYELALADILVTNGATTLTQVNITDKRFDTSVCGIVKGLIDEIDTTDLFVQYDTSFEEWFESVKSYLNETAAGNVANALAEHVLDMTAHGIGNRDNLITSKKSTIVEAINEIADYVRTPGYSVANGTNNYNVTLNPAPVAYKDGMGLVVKITNASTGPATINVNGLGAKSILKPNGLTVSNLKSNAVYSLRYNGVGFILQGEGGEEEQVVATRNWNLLLSSYKVTYADDIYYYAVKDNVAYKILKSTMTIVATLPKINNSNYTVRSFMPGLKTEVYTGSAPTQNSYAYDENNTLIKSWDNYWYYYFVNATNNYIYKFYSGTSSYNYVEFTEWNWSNTLIRTLFKENGMFATDGAFVLKDNDSGILAIANKCIYKIDSLKSNIYTRYELGYSKATYHETLMSSAIAMTI